MKDLDGRTIKRGLLHERLATVAFGARYRRFVERHPASAPGSRRSDTQDPPAAAIPRAAAEAGLELRWDPSVLSYLHRARVGGSTVELSLWTPPRAPITPRIRLWTSYGWIGDDFTDLGALHPEGAEDDALPAPDTSTPAAAAALSRICVELFGDALEAIASCGHWLRLESSPPPNGDEPPPDPSDDARADAARLEVELAGLLAGNAVRLDRRYYAFTDRVSAGRGLRRNKRALRAALTDAGIAPLANVGPALVHRQVLPACELSLHVFDGDTNLEPSLMLYTESGPLGGVLQGLARNALRARKPGTEHAPPYPRVPLSDREAGLTAAVELVAALYRDATTAIAAYPWPRWP